MEIMNGLRMVYGVKHKDETIRAESRSGGVFTALSDIVIENNGVVYGCALDQGFSAVHCRATTKVQRDAFRGSKYLQSSIGDTFHQVEKDLKNGLTVLYSGTPCQIHGLLNYLDLKHIVKERLITLDVVCHGVPSPRVWHDFLENNYGKENVEKVDFRDKKNFGWRDHVETVTVDGEEKSTKIYSKAFYSDLILREACFECSYKKTNRISDITIGDFWKIENNDKSFDDNKGVSIVMVNTSKGRSLFEESKDDLIIREYQLANCIQTALESNYIKPQNRERFWSEYNGENLNELVEKYSYSSGLSYTQKVYGKIYTMILAVYKVIIKIVRKD